MPVWLQILVALAALANFIFAAWYFFDRGFRTRKASERDKTMEKLQEQSWTPNQRMDLEQRFARLELRVTVLEETGELREKIMANILKGSKSE